MSHLNDTFREIYLQQYMREYWLITQASNLKIAQNKEKRKIHSSLKKFVNSIFCEIDMIPRVFRSHRVEIMGIF